MELGEKETNEEFVGCTGDTLTDPYKTQKPSINRLPDEILADIFYYASNMRSCPANYQLQDPTLFTKWPPFTIDPLLISHVCLRWRQVAIHTPVLWSHIDIQPDLYQADTPRTFARVEVFLKRSAQALLDVHIVDLPLVFNLDYDGNIPEPSDYLQSLISSIAPRAKSLTLRTSSGLIIPLLAGCVPGTLKTLAIEVPEASPSGSIWGPDWSAEDRATLGLPVEHFELLFFSVTTLRLCGYYPPTSSNAYHGLVELRLDLHWHSFASNSVTESALIDGLRSSPRLRVFYINCKIIDPLPEKASITPVYLDNLEVFGWSSIHQEQIGYLLRWLHPGPKPLSVSMPSLLTMPEPKVQVPFLRRETEKFLARSNVTRLKIHYIDYYFQLTEMLKLVPRVRTLAIAGKWDDIEDIQDSWVLPAGMAQVSRTPSETRNLSTSNSPIRSEQALEIQHPIESLYILRLLFAPAPEWHTIRQLVRKHNVRRLTLWSSNSHHYDNGDYEKCDPPEDLYTICPIVDIIPIGEPNPVEDWC